MAASVDGSLPDMRHRGPDEGGVWHDDDVAIGFRRLSIIDIDHSHQPLPWLDGRYQLIFNGEIYNYLELRERLARDFGATFDTDGDGEAIVAGYHYLGPKIVRELRGMFAFLIWDAQERVLFGARDWFGIKPLFTYTDERGTFFASEKKSLLDVAAPDVRRSVDSTALQHYLTLQYVPEPASMHRAIRRVESGTYFTLGPASRCAPHRYFHPDFAIKPVSERGQAVPRRSPRRSRTRSRSTCAPDVTVGSFLSGGIDSTAVAALAKRHNPKLLTFTTGFEREGYSEIDVAAESAAAIGVEHITKVVSRRGDDGDPAADRLVPRRPGGRPGAGAAVLHRPRGPQARQGRCCPARAPTSCSAATRSIASRSRCARSSYVPPPLRRGLGKLSTRIPEGRRGKDLLRAGLDRHRGALLRQRAHLPSRRDAGVATAATTRRCPTWT